VAFFRAFEGMEEGFRQRATAVEALLSDPSTAFVLITSPRRDALEEATFFADRLAQTGQTVDALIVNRVHPSFGDESPDGLRATAEQLWHQSWPEEGARQAALRLAARYDNLANFRTVADLERAHLEGLRSKIDPTAIAYVPYLAHDVYDFSALHTVGQLLFGVDAS
jgi:anion-transporting  ArsA/GET3 family ATPase